MQSLSDTIRALFPELRQTLLNMHFRRMPPEYFDRYQPAEIARHLRLIHGLHEEQLVNVDVKPLGGRAFEVCVVGYDRMGVLAAITTALVSDGFDVQDLRLATYDHAQINGEPTYFVDVVRVVASGSDLGAADIAEVLGARLGRAFQHLAGGDLIAAQTVASDSQFTTRLSNHRGRATADAIAVKEGMVLDGFRLESKIATGGMSDVYLATQLSLDRKAAVKVVSGEALSAGDLVARFTQEAQVVGGFACPYIVQALAFGTVALANGTPLRWMAMEYLPSGDLDDWLKRNGPPPAEVVVRWMDQALQGLGYAHRRGVLHRDLKPHNLLLTAEGDLKVTDFGLFKAKRSHDTFSQSRSVVGTPHYTSPEQAVAGDVDERSDIFSLGATFFQLLTGRLLFEADSAAAVLAMIAERQAPGVREVCPTAPRPLALIVDRMTRLAPEERYQNVAVILADLHSYMERGLLSIAEPDLPTLSAGKRDEPSATSRATSVTTVFRPVGACDDADA